MPRLLSAPFFSANPVFRRAEYAAAVGRRPGDKVVTAMLAQHLQAGNIRRIARGVFASVPRHADAATWSVDRFLAASRLRRPDLPGTARLTERISGVLWEIGDARLPGRNGRVPIRFARRLGDA